MGRLNLLLLVMLTLCALGLVLSQHKARQLFVALEREERRATQLDVEFGQLELEASTWATPARVDRLARERLSLRAPDARHIRMLALPEQP